jgi:hypothetical protein
MRSSEIEAAAGMTAGEVRMATKWLSDNGYLSGTRRVVRFNFGHQGFAKKPLLFWTLTDKGRQGPAARERDLILAADGVSFYLAISALRGETRPPCPYSRTFHGIEASPAN